MFEVNRASNMSPGSLSLNGKLTVNRSPGPYSAVYVRAGTLGMVGGDDDASSPVPGAWARFASTDRPLFLMSDTIFRAD